MRISKLSKLSLSLLVLFSLVSCGETSSSTTSSSSEEKTDKQKILDIVSLYENGEIKTFDKGTFTVDLEGTTKQQVKGKDQNTVNKVSADFSNERAYFTIDSKLMEDKATKTLKAKGEILDYNKYLNKPEEGKDDKLLADIFVGGLKNSEFLQFKGLGFDISTKEKTATLKGYLKDVSVSKILEETIGVSSIPTEGNLPKVTITDERREKLNRELDRPEDELSYNVITQGDKTNMYFTYKAPALSELATEANKDDDPATEDAEITVDKDATMVVTVELNKYYHPVRIISQTDCKKITKTYPSKPTEAESEVINLEERDEINFTYGTNTRELPNKEEYDENNKNTKDLQSTIDIIKEYMDKKSKK